MGGDVFVFYEICVRFFGTLGDDATSSEVEVSHSAWRVVHHHRKTCRKDLLYNDCTAKYNDCTAKNDDCTGKKYYHDKIFADARECEMTFFLPERRVIEIEAC